MTDKGDGLSERLRLLSGWLTEHDIDMMMPDGMLDPADAADELDRLQSALASERERAETARATTECYSDEQQKLFAEIKALKSERDALALRVEKLTEEIRTVAALPLDPNDEGFRTLRWLKSRAEAVLARASLAKEPSDGE